MRLLTWLYFGLIIPLSVRERKGHVEERSNIYYPNFTLKKLRFGEFKCLPRGHSTSQEQSGHWTYSCLIPKISFSPQSLPFLTTSPGQMTAFCMPLKQSQVQDSRPHAVTLASILSLCRFLTSMQTGLQLEQCHYKDPLLFINRSLQDCFSGKQLLLPPACFYALLWGAELSWQASFAFLLYVWFIKRTQRVAECAVKPGLCSWVHQKGVGTRFTFHFHVSQLGEQGENPPGEFLVAVGFLRLLIAENNSSLAAQRAMCPFSSLTP